MLRDGRLPGDPEGSVFCHYRVLSVCVLKLRKEKELELGNNLSATHLSSGKKILSFIPNLAGCFLFSSFSALLSFISQVDFRCSSISFCSSSDKYSALVNTLAPELLGLDSALSGRGPINQYSTATWAGLTTAVQRIRGRDMQKEWLLV